MTARPGVSGEVASTSAAIDADLLVRPLNSGSIAPDGGGITHLGEAA
jgi:hypothetical protein